VQSAGRNYPHAYNNLRTGYEQLKGILQKVNFQDEDSKRRKQEVLNYSLEISETPGYIPLGLKKAHSILAKNKSLFDIQDHDDPPAAEKALTTETVNIKILNSLYFRFTSDLNRVIEDIKLDYIESDDYDGLSNLIDIPQDINSRDSDGNTLLLYATSCPSSGNKILTKLLLELNADPFIKCRFNETPFSKAINSDNLDLAKKYLKHKIVLSEGQVDLQNSSSITELHKLEELNEEEFYCNLAHDLFDENIMGILGLDETSRDVCFLHIRENYVSLGLDSDELYGSD